MTCSLVCLKRASVMCRYCRIQPLVCWQGPTGGSTLHLFFFVCCFVKSLHWLPVCFKIAFKILLFFKFLIWPAFIISILADPWVLWHQPSNHSTNQNKYPWWGSIQPLRPLSVKQPAWYSLGNRDCFFKRRLKTYLIDLAFNWLLLQILIFNCFQRLLCCLPILLCFPISVDFS